MRLSPRPRASADAATTCHSIHARCRAAHDLCRPPVMSQNGSASSGSDSNSIGSVPCRMMNSPSLVIIALLIDGVRCGKNAAADGKIDASSLIPSRCNSEAMASNAELQQRIQACARTSPSRYTTT